MLEDLITEANSNGWAVSLRQHPDNRDYWEASISQRLLAAHPNGIARMIAYGQGPSPYEALSVAINDAENARLVEPSGLKPAETLSLSSLIPKPAANLPRIERRI